MTIFNCQTSVLVFTMSLLAFDVTLAANNPEDALHSKLVVGTKHVPPCAIKNSEGVWSGISIDLWKQIAGELKLDYELRELSLDELLRGLGTNSIDVALAALTVTAKREKDIDLTHLRRLPMRELFFSSCR